MTLTPETLPLREFHLPDPISWWPPAPGWWGVLLLCLLLAVTFRAVRHSRRRGELKRASLARLEQINEQFRRDADTARLATELSVLLRRIALSLYPRQQVAALTGDAWLGFLDEHLAVNGGGSTFREGVGRVLCDAPYNPDCTVDANALIELIRQWITVNAGRVRS
ncbi:MAG: DUF4381 domain-containing protein [Gammaproteobacteria bacterium]|nr:DUF4381 domain-containing protein [Gammaproteobacteria bacterium]